MKKAVDDGLSEALDKYDGNGGVWKDQIDYLQKEVGLTPYRKVPKFSDTMKTLL